MTHRSATAAATPRVCRSLLRASCVAGLLGAGLPAANAQTAAVPAQPPATSSPTTTPPDIVKPRTMGPGDSTAGVIHPGRTGDAEMHVAPPAGKSFPTPVIRPQTMQGSDTPVVPK